MAQDAKSSAIARPSALSANGVSSPDKKESANYFAVFRAASPERQMRCNAAVRLCDYFKFFKFWVRLDSANYSCEYGHPALVCYFDSSHRDALQVQLEDKFI